MREVLEETGLHVYAADVRFLTATNDIMLDERKHYVTIFVQCRIDTANATNGNELQPKVSALSLAVYSTRWKPSSEWRVADRSWSPRSARDGTGWTGKTCDCGRRTKGIRIKAIRQMTAGSSCHC